MRQAIQKTRYAAAFIITMLIFFFGFFMGLIMQYERSEMMVDELNEVKLEYSNMLLQYRYTSELSDNKDCSSLSNVFWAQMKNLNKQSQRIQDYSVENKISDEDYKQLREAYTISQIDYWLLSKKIKSLCSLNYTNILYFFDTEEDCPLCIDQGLHLDFLKKRLAEDVLIFALDGNEKGIIELLKQQYGVVKYPVLVVDEEVYGFQKSSQLVSYLCNKGNQEACEV